MERLSPVIGLQERVRGYWLTGVPDFNNLTVWGARSRYATVLETCWLSGWMVTRPARSIELYPFGSCTYCIHIGPASDPYREENVVALDKHEDDRIWQITMNRPHRLNAIGGGLGSALTEAWEAFRDDPQCTGGHPDGRWPSLLGGCGPEADGRDPREGSGRRPAPVNSAPAVVDPAGRGR